MGSAGAKLSKTEEQLVDQKRYVREPIIPIDIRYGEKVRVYKQINSTQRVAIIQKVFDTQILYQATLDIQKILAKLKHSALVQLLNIVTKKKEQLCSKFFKMKLLYEYIDNDLQKDMEQRRQCGIDLKQIPASNLVSLEDVRVNSEGEYKIYYEESELWYIVASVVAVIAYLQERNLIHGDIRPFNLCLTSENALKVMTINSYIQTNWSSYMEKLEKLDTVSTYISPIQLGALQHNVHRPIHNVPKSDIFCLGVILLELCLLESAQDIYDFSTYSINLTQRIKRIREMRRYSDHFIETLISMLKLQESVRPSPTELYNAISQFAKAFLQVVNKWKQKNQLFGGNNANLAQGTNNGNNYMANNGQGQQQNGVLNHEQLLETGQQGDNNLTEDELPNQEEGEVIQELGLLSKNENSNSFSIQKSAQNISPARMHSEDANKNNISIQSGGGGHHNDSIGKIKRDLNGEFKQNDNKENQLLIKGLNHQQESQTNFQGQFQRNLSQPLLGAITVSGNNKIPNLFEQNNNFTIGGGLQRNQSQYFQNSQNLQNQGSASNRLNLGVSQNNNNNNSGLYNQFGQNQIYNNQNLPQSNTGTFGGGNFSNMNNQNNSLFGMQNFNNTNNNNNQYNQQNMNTNSNPNQNELILQLTNMLQQKNMNNPQAGGSMNVQALQTMMADPQFSQMLLQIQQSNQNNIINNNTMQQNHHPQPEMNLFGNQGNQFGSSNNQMSMSPKFSNQQTINLQMNRAGGFNLNNQNSHTNINQNSHTNLNQNNSFYSSNTLGQTGGFGNNQFANNQLNNQFGMQQGNQFQNAYQNTNNQTTQNQQNMFNNPNTFQNSNNLNNNASLSSAANIFGKMNSLGAGSNQNTNFQQNQIPLGNTNQNMIGGSQQQQQSSTSNIFGRNRNIF